MVEINSYVGLFGNKRLERRGFSIQGAMYEKESAVLNKISKTRREYVGMCRFFNNAQITINSLVESNRKACARKVECDGHYLAVHDSTDLNFMNHSGKLRIQDEEIGPTGHSQKKGVGFMMHPSLVVDRKSGFAIGYSHTKVWNRRFGQDDRLKRQYKKQAVQDKESYKWIEGVEKSSWLCDQVASVTHVGDSDADMYELFAHPLATNEHLLIRSCKERCLYDQTENLHAHVAALPQVYEFDLEIKQTQKRQARTAKMKLAYQKVKLSKPKNTPKELPAYVEVFVVVVKEQALSVPLNEQPIEWILFTTHPVTTIEEALQIVRWYSMRWIIEELFATLKTRGLCIEDSQLEQGISLKRLALMALQVALCILQLVKDRNNDYGQKATLVFSEQALVFMQALVKTLEGQTHEQQNPHPPETLAWAAWCIGRLGGWKGYQSESPPGPRTMKRGLEEFYAALQGWNIAQSVGVT